MDCRRMSRRRKSRSQSSISFSARLPADVRGHFIGSICAVKWSSDPYADFRKSIEEMIREVGVRDWKEMEELVYCYVVLNPPHVHGLIKDAFLTVYSGLG